MQEENTFFLLKALYIVVCAKNTYKQNKFSGDNWNLRFFTRDGIAGRLVVRLSKYIAEQRDISNLLDCTTIPVKFESFTIRLGYKNLWNRTCYKLNDKKSHWATIRDNSLLL